MIDKNDLFSFAIQTKVERCKAKWDLLQVCSRELGYALDDASNESAESSPHLAQFRAVINELCSCNSEFCTNLFAITKKMVMRENPANVERTAEADQELKVGILRHA